MEQKKKRVYRKRIPYGMMNFEDVRKKIIISFLLPVQLHKQNNAENK